MVQKYLNFIRGLAVNRLGRIGVILTTTGFLCFILFEILRLAGILTNAYIGLVTYLLFPFIFIIGLLIIPFAWYKYCKKRQMSTRELLNERFAPHETAPRVIGSRVFATIAFFTIVNILFISLAGFRTLAFMDSPRFCGTACHKVMNPEWTTYQVSPHARVKCVDCHVGEGIKALVDSKMSGLRQLVKTTFNSYERPIPTPVHQLRPARETCEKCHWPQKFYGNRLKIIHRFDLDEPSTHRYITLDLKIDTGKTASKTGIHWHIAEENEVRYASVEDKRQEMLWVEVKQRDGSYKRFSNRHFTGTNEKLVEKKDDKNPRVMDCVDCHNRATHIYEDPAHAIDERISRKLVSRSLPYIKREILAAITANYPDKSMALKRIAMHLQGFYGGKYPGIIEKDQPLIDQAIEVAQEIYSRNVHTQMKVRWGTYPSFIHHEGDSGCFRCHNEDLRDKNNQGISYDCTRCHSILSYEETSPFKYLENPDPQDPHFLMHQELRDEFFKSEDSDCVE